MREKLKIGLVFTLIVLLTSCSALRKGKSGAEEGTFDNLGYSAILERVKSNNITSDGFVVKKGRIEIDGSALEGSYGFYARYNRKGDLNASVRGPLGIELIRLLSLDGHIYLVDRIGRTIYSGSSIEVLRKYGLPENVIAIIFGDYTSEGIESYRLEGRERLVITGEEKSRERIISICIDEAKVCEEIYRDMITGNEVQLIYKNFKSAEDRRFASEIKMNLKNNNLKIGLKIDDLTYGYDEEINFTIPSYRKRSL